MNPFHPLAERDPFRGLVRIGEALSKRFPRRSANRWLDVTATTRLRDLYTARSAAKDARK